MADQMATKAKQDEIAGIIEPADSELAAVPAGTENGTALSEAIPRPAGATAAIFELAMADSVTYAIKGVQPEAAPTPVVVRSGTEFRRVEQPLGPGMMIYVTDIEGTPAFMWV